MSTDQLYEAITLIDDDLIDEAGTYTPPKKKMVHWKRWTALAACLVLAVGAGGAFLSLLGGRADSNGGAGAGGSGSDGSSTFMSYAGPVFPLTTTDEAEGVTARRDITLDFAPWSSAQYATDILVTDSYTLTNTTSESKTLTFLYPFVSSLRDLGRRLPTLTARNWNPVCTSAPTPAGFRASWVPAAPRRSSLICTSSTPGRSTRLCWKVAPIRKRPWRTSPT